MLSLLNLKINYCLEFSMKRCKIFSVWWALVSLNLIYNWGHISLSLSLFWKFYLIIMLLWFLLYSCYEDSERIINSNSQSLPFSLFLSLSLSLSFSLFPSKEGWLLMHLLMDTCFVFINKLFFTDIKSNNAFSQFKHNMAVFTLMHEENIIFRQNCRYVQRVWRYLF